MVAGRGGARRGEAGRLCRADGQDNGTIWHVTGEEDVLGGQQEDETGWLGMKEARRCNGAGRLVLRVAWRDYGAA